MRKFILIAVGVTACATAFFLFGFYATDHFTGPAKGEQTVEVKPSENALELGKRLEESGILFSRYTFLWYLSHEEKLHKLVAGRYTVSGTMTVPEIATMLTLGKTVSTDIRVTFPEGFTMAQMALRLTAHDLPGKEFLVLATHPKAPWRTEFDFLATLPQAATLEGYLFPDTYSFAPDVSADAIIKVMLKNFGKKWNDILGQSSDATLDPKRFHAIVTLASIIEDEGRTEAERRMISDIFWKRLAIGQPLQSDATINYILGTTRLQPTLKDTETSSPYNTYQNKGLPPGPISNPGLMSIQAALSPESNPYYYFLVDANTGETVYAKTFEEHIKNRKLHGL